MTSAPGESVARSLDALGVHPSKRWGQNFLTDPNVIRAIVEAVGSDAEEDLVEIGPGLGALTVPLAKRARRVTAVEIDRRLVGRLAALESLGRENVQVVHGDILEFDFAAAAREAGRRVVVMGSIPYSITAPILQRLVEARASVRTAYLITQREVADKILASPGPAGTALGTFVRAYADVEILRRVPRGSFHPVPAVDSTLWKLAMLDGPRFTSPPEAFFGVVRAIYGARRKTLRNALLRSFGRDDVPAWLARADLEGGVRGETLGFDALDRLAAAAPGAPREEGAL